MDRLGYIAMSGAKMSMQAQGVVSNNLANASTAGFRAELLGSTSAPIYGDVYASRVNVKSSGAGADFSTGSITSTGRHLDVAIQGEGWIAVQAADGGEAYTRAGDLKLDSLGLMTTGSGLPVIGDGGPVAVPPHSQLTIGGDGTISVVPLGQGSNTLAVVDRIKLVNPLNGDLERGKDGLFRLRGGNAAPAEAGVTIMSGTLEGSNVNAAGSLVDMIEISRLYEMQVKMITTAKDDADAAAQLMRMR
ncbi:MAG: flagellar basal-body rod protein FlgF [Gammaproteobacteria bacterium]